MIITHELTMDLKRRSSGAPVYAMQDDRYSRNLELSVFSDGAAWAIPEDAAVLIRYSKPDGRGGEYDTLPDGRCAWSAAGNILTVALAPQVLTVPGAVRLAVTLMQEQTQVSTFAVTICVEPAVNAVIAESADYFNVPGFLPAPGTADIGQFLQIETVDALGHVTGVKAVTISDSAAVCAEPAPEDIPKVFFGGALPQTKDDAILPFQYVSKSRQFSGYCRTAAQGNSAMAFPKKNQTVSLYRDAACTEVMAVNFKDWGPQNKFCFKANWIDLTHARNIVSARLWGDVVKSRAGYADLPWLLKSSPNQGAVDGFPVKVYANGIYQGRYTINIPKEAWMANMDSRLDTHCILCSEDYGSGCFRAEAKLDGSDWTDEVHETVPDAIKTRWNEAISFVRNASDEEFIAGIGSYFDLQSLIDYYVFGLVICNLDGFGKNQLYHTYDGQKWYATVYDLDCTFGTYFSAILPYDYPRTSYEDFGEGREGNLLYIRLEELFPQAIQTRFQELKAGALSLGNIISRFEGFTDIAPTSLVEEDYAETTAGGAFTAIPLQGQSNIQQIRDYIVGRYPYAEAYIRSLGVTGSLLYLLPAETVFDGVDDCIDTGVQLFDESKSFTVICNATLAAGVGVSSGIYHALQHESGGNVQCGGFTCNTHWGDAGVYTFNGCLSTENYSDVFATVSAAPVRHALVYENGVPSAVYFIPEEGGAVQAITSFEKEIAYNQHNYPLVIGCRAGWYNAGEAFTPMTVHSFEIWDYAMTRAQAAKALA